MEFKNLSDFLEEKNKFYDVPGSDCCIMQDGKTVFRKMQGFRDAQRSEAVRGDELYNIWSCTKMLTVISALQLIEQGKLKLCDKLCDYFPEFSDMKVGKADDWHKAPAQITIENLFTMTAGFTYASSTPGLDKKYEETKGMCPTVEMIRGLADDYLAFDPGTKWKYSLCHDVIGALIEVISGMPFQTYVQKNIFDKLGMTHSSMLMSSEYGAKIKMPQYIYKNGQNVQIGSEIIGLFPGMRSIKMGPLYVSGGAAAVSSVDDYMKFLEAIRTDKLINPETKALMLQDRMAGVDTSEYWCKGYGYGLGLRVPMAGGIYTNYGWGGASGHYFGVDPVSNISYFYAQHVILGFNDYKAQISDMIMKDFGRI